MKAARACAAALLATTLTATAGLVDRGGGLVYDSARDLTWLAAPALMLGPSTWHDAAQFALDFVHAGGSDWLLPTVDYVDPGCPGAIGMGCSGSQMGHLFHARLGGAPGSSVFDASGDSPDELSGVAMLPALAEDWFWSWNVTGDGAMHSFAFHFGTGEQAFRNTMLSGRMLLVHAGDLGATAAVASPPTLPLALVATALALLLRPRRKWP